MRKLILLLMLMFAVDAYAYTGNDLNIGSLEFEKYERGQEYDSYQIAEYFGYLEGVKDVLHGIAFCLPIHSTNGQYYKIVAKYLNNNPDKLHLSAFELVANALAEAFPCKKK